MGSTTTIAFARADLSIPGATTNSEPSTGHADNVQTRFFDVVMNSNPDVIVLDFRAASPSAISAILSVRRCCPVPILVICEPGDPMTEEYRIAGASECIFAPIDILSLHRAIEGVLQVTVRAMPPGNRPNVELTLDGMSPRMQHKSLAADVGPS
jgi:hypothetical protein